MGEEKESPRPVCLPARLPTCCLHRTSWRRLPPAASLPVALACVLRFPTLLLCAPTAPHLSAHPTPRPPARSFVPDDVLAEMTGGATPRKDAMVAQVGCRVGFKVVGRVLE